MENGVAVLDVASRLVLVLLLVGCNASVSDNGKVRLTTDSYDAGAVFLDPDHPDSWIVQHEFLVQNPSPTAKAELRVAQKTCGCTHCMIEQADLEPGGATTVELSSTVPYARWSVREAVLLAMGDSETPTHELLLHADVYPRLAMVPQDLPSISVLAGNSASVQLTFVAYEPETEEVGPIELVSVGEGLSLESVDAWRVETNRV